MQVGAVISTVLYTIMIFTSNKYVLMAVMALQGAMIPLQFNIAYVYLIELMPRKFQTTISTIQNVLSTFTVTGSALYFTLISK